MLAFGTYGAVRAVPSHSALSNHPRKVWSALTGVGNDSIALPSKTLAASISEPPSELYVTVNVSGSFSTNEISVTVIVMGASLSVAVT